MFEAWKRSLDATIEVPDCEPAINAPSPRGKREPRVGGEGGAVAAAYDTPLCKLAGEGGGGYRVVRKKEEEMVREGRRWKGVALSGCESSGSREGFSSFLRGIRLEGSWQHIELPYPYFTNRGGEREKGGGRKGGGSASHKSADVRGKEGKKKRGKRKRNEREKEREFRSSPTPCFASTRKRYRRALPMKVMVNNAATECYRVERERERV